MLRYELVIKREMRFCFCTPRLRKTKLAVKYTSCEKNGVADNFKSRPVQNNHTSIVKSHFINYQSEGNAGPNIIGILYGI